MNNRTIFSSILLRDLLDRGNKNFYIFRKKVRLSFLFVSIFMAEKFAKLETSLTSIFFQKKLQKMNEKTFQLKTILPPMMNLLLQGFLSLRWKWKLIFSSNREVFHFYSKEIFLQPRWQNTKWTILKNIQMSNCCWDETWRSIQVLNFQKVQRCQFNCAKINNTFK